MSKPDLVTSFVISMPDGKQSKWPGDSSWRATYKGSVEPMVGLGREN
jgi:hypothetical protein